MRNYLFTTADITIHYCGIPYLLLRISLFTTAEFPVYYCEYHCFGPNVDFLTRVTLICISLPKTMLRLHDTARDCLRGLSLSCCYNHHNNSRIHSKFKIFASGKLYLNKLNVLNIKYILRSAKTAEDFCVIWAQVEVQFRLTLTVGYYSTLASTHFGASDQILFVVKATICCWFMVTVSGERWILPLSFFVFFSLLYIWKILEKLFLA
jgi:hypothetical protein